VQHNDGLAKAYTTAKYIAHEDLLSLLPTIVLWKKTPLRKTMWAGLTGIL